MLQDISNWIGSINPWYAVLLLVIVLLVVIAETSLRRKIIMKNMYVRGFADGQITNMCSVFAEIEKGRYCSLSKSGRFVPYDPELEIMRGQDPMLVAMALIKATGPGDTKSKLEVMRKLQQ